MGQKQSSNPQLKVPREEISKNHFEFLYVVGKGGFGKVWKVQMKKTKKQYALKEMAKAKIIDKKSEKSIKYERELLSRLKHPFIVNMQYAFQDFENLYLVMDLLTGGDLRYHVSRHKKFSEEQTSLEYLHNNNVLHRDIKPENLVLDERGYVRITDFGIAKLYQKENSSETSGTPGYMSPEVMCAQNHTIAVDYFAVGVIAFEFMNGRRPYVGKSRKEIKEQIMAKQVQVKPTEIPEGWSEESADFINRLLQRKPINRLGLKGAQEVKDHPWLKYYPWKDLYEKNFEPPFVPKIGDNFDKRYCESQDKLGNSTMERYQKYVREDSYLYAFHNFTYINNLELGDSALAMATSTTKTNSITVSSNQLSQGSYTNTINKPKEVQRERENSSNRKYPAGINILKNKVKIVDNSVGHGSSSNLASASRLSYGYSNQKMAQNVKSLYNNYLNQHNRNYSANFGNSISNLSHMSVNNNINRDQIPKYSPYREKKLSMAGSLLEASASHLSSSTTNLNKNIGSTSTTNLLQKGIINAKLPNISNLDKLRITKRLTGSASSSTVFKNYKPSGNSQSSTSGGNIGGSLKFFNK